MKSQHPEARINLQDENRSFLLPRMSCWNRNRICKVGAL